PQYEAPLSDRDDNFRVSVSGQTSSAAEGVVGKDLAGGMDPFAASGGWSRAEGPKIENQPVLGLSNALPPPARTPKRTKAPGEDTGYIPNGGPAMRRTQDRTPPAPAAVTSPSQPAPLDGRE